MNRYTRLMVFSWTGIFGSVITALFGGWSSDMTTLVLFMGADFLTGLTAAAFCKSSKTESGGLSSKVVWLGLCKKLATLLMVAVAHRIDLALGVAYIRSAAAIAFIVSEALSIVENAGALGVPLPKVVEEAIDLLKKRGE